MKGKICLFIWSVLMGAFFMFHVFIDVSHEEVKRFGTRMTHVAK